MGLSREDTFNKFDQGHIATLDQVKQRRVTLVKQVFIELGRYLKGIKLYGINHQSALQFKGKFLQHLTDTLEECLAIDLDVYAYSFEVDGHVILESPEGEDHFIYRMHTDGIRKLIFIQGITEEQVDAFIEIILTDWSSTQLFEDNMVTLLWAAHLDQLKFEYIKRAGAQTSRFMSHLNPEQRERSAHPRHSMSALLDGFVGAIGEAERPLSLDLSSDLSLERAAIEPLVVHESREYLEKVLYIIQVAYALGEGRRAHQEVSRLVHHISLLCLQSGSVGELERFMRQAITLSVQDPRGLQRLREYWNVPTFVRSLLDTFNRETPDQFLSIFACLNLLGPDVTPQVIYSLGVIPKAQLPNFRALLSKYMGRYLVEVNRGLRRLEFEHVCFLIDVAYQSEDEALICSVMRGAYSHEGREVRDRAIRTLPERIHGHPEAVALYIRGLNDTASKIQSLCLFRLSACRGEEAASALKEYISSTERPEATLVEHAKMLVTLSLMGEPPELFQAIISAKSPLYMNSSKAKLAAWLGWACACAQRPDHSQEALKVITGRLSGFLLKGEERLALTWARAYLSSEEEARTYLVVSLILRSSLGDERA